MSACREKGHEGLNVRTHLIEGFAVHDPLEVFGVPVSICLGNGRVPPVKDVELGIADDRYSGAFKRGGGGMAHLD